MHTSTFWLKFGSLSPAVTLKIRARSPNPNQLFIMSQCYIHANLVKIHSPVHEISCKQESVTPTPTPTLTLTQQDPHQKQYVPLPFGGGHNYPQLKHCFRTISIKLMVVWGVCVWGGGRGGSLNQCTQSCH